MGILDSLRKRIEENYTVADYESYKPTEFGIPKMVFNTSKEFKIPRDAFKTDEAFSDKTQAFNPEESFRVPKGTFKPEEGFSIPRGSFIPKQKKTDTVPVSDIQEEALGADMGGGGDEDWWMGDEGNALRKRAQRLGLYVFNEAD